MAPTRTPGPPTCATRRPSGPTPTPGGYLHAGRPADRPLPLARAEVVGGSSTTDACFWPRGSAADHDAWAALGNPGWSFADLLPFFRGADADPLGGPFHGTDGPVPVHRADEGDLNPIDLAYADAARALGLPWSRTPTATPCNAPASDRCPRTSPPGCG